MATKTITRTRILAISVLLVFAASGVSGVASAFTITTLTSGASASIPWQEHIWGPTLGRYWLFYFDGNYYRYTTCSATVQPCKWAQPTIPITGPGSGSSVLGMNDMGFWVDATTSTVYSVGSKNTASENEFYFRSGTLLSGGTINWSTETSGSTNQTSVTSTSVIVGSDGSIWAGMRSGPSTNFHFEVYSLISSSWTLSMNIPTGDGKLIPSGDGILVPLSGGKVAAIYDAQGATVRTCSGICLGNSDWSSPVTCPKSSTPQLICPPGIKINADGATHVGDTVEYCHASGVSVYYLSFNSTTLTWDNSTVLASQKGTSGNCAITTDGTSNIAIAFSNDYVTTGYSTTAYTVCSKVPLAQCADKSSWWTSPYTIQTGVSCTSQHHNMPPISQTTFPLIWYLGCNPPFTIDFAVFPYQLPAGTTATVVNPNPVTETVGNPIAITYNATVTYPSVAPTPPTGSVNWNDGGKGGTFGSPSCALASTHSDSGSCIVTYTPSPTASAGTIKITATYNGDSTHTSSTGSSTLKMNKRSTTTSVSLNPTSVYRGTATTLTAIVSDSSPGSGTAPTGKITWSASVSGGSFSSTPPTCTLSPISATQSQCSITYTAPPSATTVTLTAQYASDNTHNGSSKTAKLTVT